MTDARKIEKLRALVEQRANDGSQSHERARSLLIKEGIYDEKGKISADYGGGGVYKKRCNSGVSR